MEPDFWLERWAKKETAFHQMDSNPFLVRYFNQLRLKKDARVFVPLCGKTRDIAWLLSRGYQVTGAELSEQAILELFSELEMTPEVTPIEKLKHYRGPNLDIYVGNIFEISKHLLGPVNAVYDRAALVALPREMRYRYTAHLMEITDCAPQLLVVYEYDQRLQEGPPFSINEEEVRHHYEDAYGITVLETQEVPGGLKSKSPAAEKVYLLKAKGQ